MFRSWRDAGALLTLALGFWVGVGAVVDLVWRWF